MTRNDFITDPPQTIGDLVDFCGLHRLCAADDVFPGADLDEKLCDDIRELSHGEYWYNIRDFLDSIPEGCDWYRYEDGTYYDFDDGWEDLYDAILDEMDNDELWDEEEDEEYEPEDDGSYYFTDGEEDGEEDADGDVSDDEPQSGVFSIDDLFDSDAVSVIRAEAEENERKSKAALEEAARSFASMMRSRDEESRRAEDEAEGERVLEFWKSFLF